jgi:hypothetical protein
VSDTGHGYVSGRTAINVGVTSREVEFFPPNIDLYNIEG